MKLAEIKRFIFDRVYIYSKCSLETLWSGTMENVPEKYLNCKIGIIGAKRKGILDIGIEWPLS